jgi:ubiquinone/menaquinone biosynthesis C-methylase UbiE
MWASLATIATATAAAYAAPADGDTSANSALVGQKLYDHLYQIGYHQDLSLSHARSLLREIVQMKNEVASVLDVGCSHGFAVQSLWLAGISSNGVDISKVAVNIANQNRTEGRKCQYEPCFKQADAAHLPFADKAFDGILSTDVLEHVQPEEVHATCAELARVAKKYLFLKIAYKKEVVVSHLHKLQKQGLVVRGGALHATVMGPSAWITEFWKVGFRVHGVSMQDGIIFVRTSCTADGVAAPDGTCSVA